MRFAIILIPFLVALAGCVSPADGDTPTPVQTTTPTTPAASTAPRVHSVQEGDANFFDPETLSVGAGTTVTWDIVGSGHHTVDFLGAINAEGETPKSGDLGPGDTFEVTFSEPGTYQYYCKYHSNKQTGMMGTIVVE